MSVSIVFTSQDRAALQSIAKLEAKVIKLDEKLKAVGTSGKTAGDKIARIGKKGKGAFGKQAVGSLASYAAGFVSIGAAVALATRALTDFRKTQDEAASRITTGERSRRALAQVASDTKQFTQLTGVSDILRTELGVDQVRSDQITFGLQSAGKLKSALLFGGLENIGFSPEAAIEAAEKTQANFGGAGPGRTGGGTDRQIINKVLAAAQESPVTAGRIARASAIAATEFASIGGQDESLSALVAVLAKPFKTEQLGAERIKTLSAAVKAKRQFIGSDLQGLDLLFALPGLAEAGKLTGKSGKPVTSIDEFLGSKEAAAGLDAVLKQRPEIERIRSKVVRAELTTGTEDDILAQRLALVDSDPKLRAALAARVAKQKRQLGEETKLGPATLQADKFINDRLRARRDAGASELSILIEKGVLSAGRFVRGDKAFLEDAGVDEERTRSIITGRSPAEIRRLQGFGLDVPGAPEAQPVGESLLPAAEKMNEAAEKLLEAALSFISGGGNTLGRVDDDPGGGARG